MIDSQTAQLFWHDFDAREERLRAVVEERLAHNPPAGGDDEIIATYFLACRTIRLDEAVAEISYHATSGIKHPPAGSLLEQCSARPAGVDAFDATGRLGLLHVAFPLKMMLHPDGHLTSCDVLHTVAAAVIFDFYENQDARLVRLQMPERILRTFPGPAYGPSGLRRLTGFAPEQPAFGTILKPTAGITALDVERLVAEVAGLPLFMFIKEDEDLYPDLDYAPVRERVRRAMAQVRQAKESRGGLGLLFAPHISSAPHEMLALVQAALDEGANALMFSETFAGGATRMIREATRHLPNPPALYVHNAGIGVKTRGIWREVIDFLARLDGMDIRQTAPVRVGPHYIRPYGREWEASEAALSRAVPGINPTMLARAGALDQGNIGLNLADAERRGLSENVLFLAGSAINAIKDANGRADPRLGAEAMLQAIEVHRSGEMDGTPAADHLNELYALARREGRVALAAALEQRYPALAQAQ